ncbi:MAG: hypothetical protein HC897_11885 [Thermoanaerobaculia bacterium]|nr:hypothetical protein [Thermoanaerobaculia bacterium]
MAAVAVLGTSWANAQDVPGPAAATSAISGISKAAPAHKFPNVVLRTHEGKTVRFYDDLVKDKIVMINFMYAECKKR